MELSPLNESQEKRSSIRTERKRAKKPAFSSKNKIPQLDSGWFLALCIAIALWLAAPKIGKLLTVIGLLFMIACMVQPISHLKWVRRGNSRKKKAWKFRSLMAIAIVAIAGFGYFVWPATPYYHNLSRDEIERFNNFLGHPPVGGEQVRLGCPPANEDICVFAGQFLPLFQRAGWKVEGNMVERVIVTKPTSGIVLFLHGEGSYDPSNPDSGLWTALTKGRIQIRAALTSISLQPREGADITTPNRVIGIYFGPAPQP